MILRKECTRYLPGVIVCVGAKSEEKRLELVRLPSIFGFVQQMRTLFQRGKCVYISVISIWFDLGVDGGTLKSRFPQMNRSHTSFADMPN